MFRYGSSGCGGNDASLLDRSVFVEESGVARNSRGFCLNKESSILGGSLRSLEKADRLADMATRHLGNPVTKYSEASDVPRFGISQRSTTQGRSLQSNTMSQTYPRAQSFGDNAHIAPYVLV